MKLYIIVLFNDGSSVPITQSFIDTSEHLFHGTGCTHTVERETSNCWFIKPAVKGIPTQLRKANEYRIIGNANGVYMFGRDAQRLIQEWNNTVIA